MTSTYTYRGDGRLHMEESSFYYARVFHWAGPSLIGEADGNGNLLRSYAWMSGWAMGGLLAEAPGSDPSTADYRYFHPDQHGSVREVRDGDKALMARFEYGPYGGPRAAVGVSSAFGYTGMRQSDLTGQYKFPLRDYDPDLARWTTRDPLGMADGPNMHGYVDGNPASAVDSSGGSSRSIFDAPGIRWLADIGDCLGGTNPTRAMGDEATSMFTWSTRKELPIYKPLSAKVPWPWGSARRKNITAGGFGYIAGKSSKWSTVGKLNRITAGVVPGAWPDKAVSTMGWFGRASAVFTIGEGFYQIGRIARCGYKTR